MSDENGKQPNRRRRALYKKDDKDEDVLKKLKEVRQNLQDSLKDEKGVPETKKAGAEKGTAREPGAPRPRYFRKEDFEEPESLKKKPKKVSKKPVKPVSQRRFAMMNRRVRARMDKLKGYSRKKKATILIWLVIMTVPFFFLSTLAVVGLEFDFGDFGLTYNENKEGTIMISFPCRNPSFLPAQLGVFEIDLYTGDGKFVGKAYNNDFLLVNPYQTKRLYVSLSFDPENGGAWMSDLLSDLVLSLKLGQAKYNGLAIDASFVPEIQIDISPIIGDLITGMLDIEELIGGLDLGGILPGGDEAESSSLAVSSDSERILIDPYTNPRKATLIERTIPKLSQFDDLSANVSFAMSENEEEFNLGLSAAIGLSDLIPADLLGGINIGPIKLDNLDVQIMVNNKKDYKDKYELQDDDDWYTHYDVPIAKLFSTKPGEVYIGDPLGRDTVIGMNLTLYKDDPDDLMTKAGEKVHPSAFIDWEAKPEDDYSLQSFLAGTGAFDEFDVAWKQFPTWHFLYNVLSEGGLDCGIKINNIDINIFGLIIEDLSIPMNVLPPIFISDGTLDPDNFLKIAPDYGLTGMIKHMEKGLFQAPAMAMLGIPVKDAQEETEEETEEEEFITPEGLPKEKDIMSFLDDFIGMVELPSIDPLNLLTESFGQNASLDVDLEITLNNKMLSLYAGFEGMKISIASDSETSKDYKNVLEVKLKGGDDDFLFIPGINSIVDVGISVKILKNETLQPHVAKLLRSLLEDWTLDCVITAEFDKLVLLKEKMTYGAFDVAIPLKLELEDMLIGMVSSMAPDLIGGLVGDALSESSSSSGIPGSPLGLLYGLWSPLPGLLSVLTRSDQIIQLARSDYLSGSNNLQTSQEEESDDFLGDMVNDLIGGLLGDTLGTEIEFNLGFNVTVSTGYWTKMTIHVGNFYMDEFFLSIGLGDTDLRLQSKNRYGEWEDMVGIEIEDYFEIKSQRREEIIVSIYIYEGQALTNFLTDFINEFFSPEKTNTLDLRVAGTTTLNLSGIYIPDLSLELALEDLDTGIQGTDIIDGVFDMIYDLELDAESDSPSLLDNLWGGSLKRIPLLSQAIDLESMFHLGTISIDEISETDFANKSKGVGVVKLSIGELNPDPEVYNPTINYLMGLDIKDLAIAIYDEDPQNELTAKKLIEISIDDGVGLTHGSGRRLEVTLKIYKSQECEDMINYLIENIALTGWLHIAAELEVFGCNINLKPTYLPAINLTKLPIDITTLLSGVMNPLVAPFLTKVNSGPQASQDIDINLNSIFENVLQFGIGDIALGEFNYDCGPLNYDDPTLTVDLGLWIETFFNMSINSMDLKLLDGDIYKALHVDGGFDFDDVAREAEIGRIILSNPAAYFNSCIPYSQELYGEQVHDPDKPYIVNQTSDFTYDNDTKHWVSEEDFGERVLFEQDRNRLESVYGRDLDEGVSAFEFNETGFTSDNYIYLSNPTLGKLDLQVQLFNKSHGSWETRYARKYWRALGGPYFPAQYYGKEYGGYPDHYYTYHKYYAPLVNLVSKALGLLDEQGIAADPNAISNLISGIAIAGTVNVTIFSMDVILDLNNPRLNSMFEPISGLLLGMTGTALKSYLYDVVNPWSEKISPKESFLTDMMLSQDLGAMFGDLPISLDVIPMELTTVFHGFTFPGIMDRSDHVYNTNQRNLVGNESRVWDGTMRWVENPDGSYADAASEAIFADYTMDPENMDSYVGSLDDPYFDGKETFYKDKHYEEFKQIVDNYIVSTKRKYNPYFETYYSRQHKDGRIFYQEAEKIEDSTKWPLRYEPDYDGRVKTAVITFHIGLALELPVGLLAGALDLYIEDPNVPCGYMPHGYIWLNSSTNIMGIDQILKDPWNPDKPYDLYTEEHFDEIMSIVTGEEYTEENSPYDIMVNRLYNYDYDGDNPGKLGEDSDDVNNNLMALCICGETGNRSETPPGHMPTTTGMLPSEGWVVPMSLRFFEGIASKEFFNVLVGSLLSNFAIVIQGKVNISLFGYEFYNLFLPNDIAKLGDPTSFYDRCLEYLESEKTGEEIVGGLPNLDGIPIGDVSSVVTEYDDLYPHYLLIGDPLELEIAFPMSAILPFDRLMSIFDDILSLLDYIEFGLLTDPFGIWLSINIPLEPGGGWLNVYLVIGLDDIVMDVDVNLPNICPVALWISALEVQLTLGGNQFNIKTYTPGSGMDVSDSHPNRELDDPFDFRYNAYANFTIPNHFRLKVQDTLPTGKLLVSAISMIFESGLDLEALLEDLNIRLQFLIPAGLDMRIWLDLGMSELEGFI